MSESKDLKIKMIKINISDHSQFIDEKTLDRVDKMIAENMAENIRNHQILQCDKMLREKMVFLRAPVEGYFKTVREISELLPYKLTPQRVGLMLSYCGATQFILNSKKGYYVKYTN